MKVFARLLISPFLPARHMTKKIKLLQVKFHRTSDDCPFSNTDLDFTIHQGECFWIKGPSGCGKTTITTAIADLDDMRGGTVEDFWDESIREEEKVGVLFQQGVLIDTLNVYENISLSRYSANLPIDDKSIKRYLTAVGLKVEDGYKMPGELSGGMLRRAALAQILAQEKKVIVLDEPFVGLDEPTANGIIDTLIALRDEGQSFILITHEHHYGVKLATPKREINLLPTPPKKEERSKKNLLPNWRFSVRLMKRFRDYFGISTPLIVFAFLATGLAISMLFLQMMHDLNMQKMLENYMKNAHLSFFEQIGYDIIAPDIKNMVTKYMPLVKQKLYQLVMIQSFLFQLSPLLTALLLVGRIGGSYTGEVAMMQATNQNALLKTLSISPRRWSLLPATIAALIAAPLLTLIGSFTALLVADLVAVYSDFSLYKHVGQFMHAVAGDIFTLKHIWRHPFVVIAYRSIGFMAITLVVAEVAANIHKRLQPRHVPKTITWSVVIASLIILIADWGFTEIYLYTP